MNDLFEMRAERPGIRLHRLELFNWGTFDSSGGEVYVARPEGRTSLLVGRNGAGKSTLVDAILTLLVPGPIRNYNVAAGAKKTERTERSYVLGACDQQLDEEKTGVTKKYLRSGTAFYSVVLAHFHDDHTDSGFTIAQILYPKADGSVDHLHLFSEGSRSIQGDLSGLSKSDGILATLKARGFKASRTFSEYHHRFVKRAGLKPLAMDMFNQTVAVKDIQSLNRFIRDHMLESSGGKERVARVIEHFAELRTAHRQLVRVTMQHDALLPIEKHGRRYHDFRQQLGQTESLIEAADPFFRETCIRLATPQLQQHCDRHRQCEQHSDQLKLAIDEANEQTRQIRNEIDVAGGDRLREIPQLIKIQQERRGRKQERRHTFDNALARTGHDESVDSDDDFQRLVASLRQRKIEIDEVSASLTIQRDEHVITRANCRTQRRVLAEELETLNKRKTSLPGYLSQLREMICQDTGLGESDLVFASELIAVRPEEAEWEASAEMVLRSFALSLLVPEKYYRSVSHYINGTRLAVGNRGQRLIYLKVAPVRENQLSADQLHRTSLCHKLQYRPRHPLTPWVTAHVENRFDYRCCETMDQFREAPRLAMTQNRHLKMGDVRHEKDDRSRSVDPSEFVLGWDNREKKRRLEQRIAELDNQIAEMNTTIGDLEQRTKRLADQADAIRRCFEIESFQAIDFRTHQLAIETLQREAEVLKSNNDRVRVLEEGLAEKTAESARLDTERTELGKQIGALEKEIQQGKTLIETATAKLKTAQADGRYQRGVPLFDLIIDQVGTPELTFDDFFDREEAFRAQCDSRARQLRSALHPIEGELTTAMGSFLKRCPEEKDDLDCTVEALPSYLAKLQTIRDEDLPRHEARFKERLNDTVTKEIGVFHSELQNEGRHIVGKINELNEALRELPYNDGTHMRLDVRPVKNAEIADFRSSLRACLDDAFEDSDAAREARFKRIETLIGRLSEQSTWRDRVIDVRRWYDFGACEVETETGVQRGYYEDSSGQSGGEKAKLAFTILVAAIAYQYDLDLTGRSDGGFHFVVVDEMFSKIDDKFAEYALKLFERFGLQLIIVAPLDAKARVTEPFVQYYLQILKDERSYRSQLITMTAKEYHTAVVEKVG